MTDQPMTRAQTDAWELRRIASKLRAGRQIWLSEEADVLDRIAARAQAAPEDLAALADRLDSEAGIADRPGQLDRLEGIAAQLRAHRCAPAVEVATTWTPGPWLMEGECLVEGCASRAVSHRHSIPTTPPASAAPAPLAVGDTVETIEQLTTLPDGAVVRGPAFVAQRGRYGWEMVGISGRMANSARLLPAVVLDLPTGGDQ